MFHGVEGISTPEALNASVGVAREGRARAVPSENETRHERR